MKTFTGDPFHVRTFAQNAVNVGDYFPYSHLQCFGCACALVCVHICMYCMALNVLLSCDASASRASIITTACSASWGAY